MEKFVSPSSLPITTKAEVPVSDNLPGSLFKLVKSRTVATVNTLSSSIRLLLTD